MYFKQGRACRFQVLTKVVHSGRHSEAHYVLALAERLFLDVCDAPVRSSSRWLFRRFMWQRTLSFNSEQRVEIGEEYSS